MGLSVTASAKYVVSLETIFTVISEGAVFKMSDGAEDVVFNENGIYKKIVDSRSPVDITGDKEAKGSLRILKSALGDSLNPYLNYDGKEASAGKPIGELDAYQQRVSTLFKLNSVDFDMLMNHKNVEETQPAERNKGAENTILYGVPGAGKSYTVKHDYCDDENRMERVVFHPDYTYSDFVGQILPVLKKDEGAEEKIVYEFVAGPFTKILKKAYENPAVDYFLVIEEINRGNAPAIFGDVFQLLDRSIKEENKGESEYGITNSDIAKEVYGDPNHMVKIPSNLSILCTMNTSDQNVFTLDTAFQRRWNMRLIENTFKDTKEEKEFAGTKILDTNVTWESFCTKINEIILNKNVRMTSSEDKRLGTHFVTEADLKFAETKDLTGADLVKAQLQNRRFQEKVIKYLWDDAFKFNREEIFDIAKFNSLESVIRKFIGSEGDKRFDIFLENIREDLVKQEEKQA